MIYTYSNFGYEGSIVSTEVDFRNGIPAVDIAGLADNCVKETRERALCAIRNSAYSIPSERVLISLSPADLKKDGASLDLPIAMAIISKEVKFIDEPMLVMGELELSGTVRAVRGMVAAANTALASGIKYVICSKYNADELKGIDGLNILAIENFSDIELATDKSNFIKNTVQSESSDEVIFPDVDSDESFDSIKGHGKMKRAIAIAVAGKLNILAYGAPGCGKTMLLQRMRNITPLLTDEEKQSVARIYSIAGLNEPKKVPFRFPHQTASIEGICGGGINCRPGEISLAHNGILFLDEAAEFRSSILQMLRVPLESKSITLSRAGRCTTFPANFQLALATNPCPCGNFGSYDKICLCSARSIEQYWKKFSGPLLDRIHIKFNVQKDDNEVTEEQMRVWVRTAYNIQRKRGVYNKDIKNDIELTSQVKSMLKNIDNSREYTRIVQIALTIANMEGREEILKHDVEEALMLNNFNLMEL